MGEVVFMKRIVPPHPVYEAHLHQWDDSDETVRRILAWLKAPGEDSSATIPSPGTAAGR